MDRKRYIEAVNSIWQIVRIDEVDFGVWSLPQPFEKLSAIYTSYFKGKSPDSSLNELTSELEVVL